MSKNGKTKDVTSVSLDAELISRAKKSEHINLSGLCNDLLEEYFDSGDASKARLEAKRDRLLEQKEDLERELAHLEDELSQIDTQLEQVREQEQEREQQVKQLAEQLPPHRVDADNAAILNWAGKLDLSPATLAEKVEEQQPDVAASRR